MATANDPTLGKRQLIKSVLLALLIGTMVLVTAVLPAEYNLDPLGTGKLFGFGRLYVDEENETIQMNTGQEGVQSFEKLKLEKLGSPDHVPIPPQVNAPAPEKQYEVRNDLIAVLVPPGKGIEYKFKARKYGSIKYEWTSNDNNILYLDFHGEVFPEKEEDKQFYESYTKAYSNNMTGTFTVPFEGKHGWYFRNQNKDTVEVTLKLKGQYQLLGR